MAVNNQAIIAVPQSSAPSVVTASNQDSQAILLQAMMSNMNPQQQASVQAALQQQARIAANRMYMEATERKVAPALTNGLPTQAYSLNTPLTFNLTTALSGFCEGIIVRYVVNYTLAAGTSAVYGLTPAGALGLIDTIEVRYNKSQHKFRPQMLRQLALMGALEDYVVPESVLAGQSQAALQAYLNPGMSVTVGAQTVTMEFFVPFALFGYNDPRGLLPIIVGDTGIQVLVNTPLAIFGSDPTLALYAVSGTGHAVTAVSGTVAISAVYRDGDCFMGSSKLPFDMSAVQGTYQMQIDNQLLPLVANSYQRTKLSVMGHHLYVLLLVVDGIQSSQYALTSNIIYIETAKDGVGGNTFWKYGTQTNMSIQEYFYLKRLDFKQDLDQGIIPIFTGPITRQGDPHLRSNKQYLDNTRDGWPDWRYNVTVAAVGTGTLNGLQCTPRIEPHLFYINPTGLIPV